jgi:hypothetical protein
MDRYQYQYIADEFPEEIQFSKKHIKIFTLDIECGAENGFPDVQNPIEELLAITVKNQSNKQIITWGTGEFKTDRTDVTYVRCKSEKALSYGVYEVLDEELSRRNHWLEYKVF